MPLTPSFLVNGTAEEMATYYADVFPDGEVLDVFRTAMPGSDEEVVVTASARVNGTDLLFVNGGSGDEFNDAISLTINCEDQAEVDHFWNRFVGDGGQPRDCAWCQDKFGVRWQVTPVEMPKLLGDPDPERAARAMQAMMTMQKIDLNAMKAAMDGKDVNV